MKKIFNPQVVFGSVTPTEHMMVYSTNPRMVHKLQWLSIPLRQHRIPLPWLDYAPFGLEEYARVAMSAVYKPIWQAMESIFFRGKHPMPSDDEFKELWKLADKLTDLSFTEAEKVQEMMPGHALMDLQWMVENFTPHLQALSFEPSPGRVLSCIRLMMVLFLEEEDMYYSHNSIRAAVESSRD